MPLELAPFRAAIFDLDGTLVLSEPAWEEAKRRVAGRLGRELPHETLAAYVGRNLPDFIAEVLGDLCPPAGRPALAAEIEAEAERLMPAAIAPVPGAVAFARRLREAGLRLAVCSSSAGRIIAAALEAIGAAGLFELSVSAAGMPRGKPDPLPYLATLDRLGLPAAAAFAIEDSLPGARSAHGAGLFTIAVGPGCREPRFGFCQRQAEHFGELTLA